MVPCQSVEWQRSPLGPELPSGEAHLWLTRVVGEADDGSVLTAGERARAVKFRFAPDRQRWIEARILLRVVLGRYLAVPPGSLVLETDDRGCPFVRWPDRSQWLRFSPTRSGNLVLVAVARTSVGVDVERIRTDLDCVAIARRVLGDDVAHRLAAIPGEDRVQPFFRAWVREEARGKCRGTGLVEPEDPVRRDPLHVVDLTLEEGYAAALAAGGELKVVRGFSASTTAA
jgi:4'-phosphopantetheinyl transferase